MSVDRRPFPSARPKIALRSRTARIGAVAAVLVAGAVAAHELGWLAAPRDWQTASGWARVPAELRPSDGPLWSPTPDSAPPEIRWLGHSGFVVRWHGVTLLLDPNTRARCTVTRRVLEPAVEVATLGPIDAALISHAHYDHLDMATLRAAAPKALVLPRGSEEYFDEEDWSETVRLPLSVDGSTRFGEVQVIAVPAAHNGSRFHPLRSPRLAVGYILRAGDDALYYAGDTGFGDHFAAIARRYRPRVALLPIGAWSPRFPMKFYHLSPREAVAAARILGVDTVVPAHFGTFRLSLDLPASALPRFARAAHDAGLRWRMPLLWRADGSVASVESGRSEWTVAGGSR